MKYLLTLICLTIASGSVQAQFTETGGFKDNNIKINTVTEAKQMRDDSFVVLEGRIEKQIKSEDYLFTDATGSIVVEIDDDDWKGVTVTPQDTVIITGEVDKEFTTTEIDVKTIKIK